MEEDYTISDAQFEATYRPFPFVSIIDHGRFNYRIWFSELLDQWVLTCGVGFMYFESMKLLGDYVKAKGY